MKKLVIASIFLAGASFANADYRVVSGDGSDISELCVAAVASKDALLDTAAAIGINSYDLDTIRCNSLTLSRFAGKYRSANKQMSADKQMNVGYALKKSDESAVTELCIAAASSDLEYQRVRAMHFSEAENVEEEVMCNGMPLRTFARKYGASDMSISLR